jgi:DNA-binding GntR family transcriptional regulator
MTGVTERVESYYRATLDQLDSGGRLPSERSVMVELETCRSTIRLVLTKLKAEELLYPVHGRGYFKR